MALTLTRLVAVHPILARSQAGSHGDFLGAQPPLEPNIYANTSINIHCMNKEADA